MNRNNAPFDASSPELSSRSGSPSPSPAYNHHLHPAVPPPFPLLPSPRQHPAPFVPLQSPRQHAFPPAPVQQHAFPPGVGVPMPPHAAMQMHFDTSGGKMPAPGAAGSYPYHPAARAPAVAQGLVQRDGTAWTASFQNNQQYQHHMPPAPAGGAPAPQAAASARAAAPQPQYEVIFPNGTRVPLDPSVLPFYRNTGLPIVPIGGSPKSVKGFVPGMQDSAAHDAGGGSVDRGPLEYAGGFGRGTGGAVSSSSAVVQQPSASYPGGLMMNSMRTPVPGATATRGAALAGNRLYGSGVMNYTSSSYADGTGGLSHSASSGIRGVMRRGVTPNVPASVPPFLVAPADAALAQRSSPAPSPTGSGGAVPTPSTSTRP